MWRICFIGNIDITKFLIELGANINYIHSHNGWTPLHNACHFDNLEIVQQLVDFGADINIKNVKEQFPHELATKEEIKSFLENYDSTKFVLK